MGYSTEQLKALQDTINNTPAGFVEQTGGIAGIGRLQDATAILTGQAGTLVQ